MFKYRNIDFCFIWATLLATIATQHTNLASTKDISINTNTDNDIIIFNSVAKTISQTPPNVITTDEVWDGTNLELLATLENNKTSYDNSDASDNNEEVANSRTRKIKIVLLSFFLLLFVSFGIFYPFLLFYKWLLGVKKNEVVQLEPDYEPSLTKTYFNPESQYFEQENDNYQATVSKLQIAFSSQAHELQHKLSQTILNLEINTDRGRIELMRQTISVLIKQPYWTHVSHNSASLPLSDVQTAFDAIFDTEHSKLMREERNLSNDNTQIEKSHDSSHNNSYKYTVVTLILCTSHKNPLFKTIHTKEQLIEQLVELSKMQEDDLIKFELLWNPQTANKYINNNQLLREYSDMLRLF